MLATVPAKSKASEHERHCNGKCQSRAKQPSGNGIQPVAFGRRRITSLSRFNSPPDIFLEARRQGWSSPRLAEQANQFVILGFEIRFIHLACITPEPLEPRKNFSTRILRETVLPGVSLIRGSQGGCQ